MATLVGIVDSFQVEKIFLRQFRASAGREVARKLGIMRDL
jgi:hypothetical protein